MTLVLFFTLAATVALLYVAQLVPLNGWTLTLMVCAWLGGVIVGERVQRHLILRRLREHAS